MKDELSHKLNESNIETIGQVPEKIFFRFHKPEHFSPLRVVLTTRLIIICALQKASNVSHITALKQFQKVFGHFPKQFWSNEPACRLSPVTSVFSPGVIPS